MVSPAILRKNLPPVICTTDRAAEVLGVSRSRVRQMAKDGRLRSWRVSDRIVFFDLREVERLALVPRKTGRPRGGLVLD